MEALALLILLGIIGTPICLFIVLFISRNKTTQHLVRLENEISRLRTLIQESNPQQLTPEQKQPEEKVKIATLCNQETPVRQTPVTHSAPVADKEPPALPVAEKSTRKTYSNDVPLFDWLRKLQQALIAIGCLPPADMQRGEANLIQWWAPRIGGFCALLAAIFFAVYIAKDTNPWIRFAELLGCSLGIVGLGKYFLSRNKQFGTALLSTGLAMVYFSAVAAYTAPPVRIIFSAWLGMTVQFIAALAVLGVALLLRNKAIATLSTIFIYASAIFSAYEGFREAALLSSLAIYIASLALLHKLNWSQVFSTASVGVYLPLLAIGIFDFLGLQSFPPDTRIALCYLCVVLPLYPLYVWVKSKTVATETTFNKALLSIHSSLCLASGYLFYKFVAPESLADFYGWMFAPFFVLTILFALRSTRSYGFHLFYLKACALGALWIVTYFSGDIRWMALIIQALVMAFSARRAESRFIAWASLAAQGYSLALMIWNASSPPDLWTLPWALLMLYLWLHFLSLSIIHQAFIARHVLAWATMIVGAIIALIYVSLVTDLTMERGLQPLYLASSVVAVLLPFFLPICSKRLLGVPASIGFLAAHLLFWFTPLAWESLLALLMLSAGFIFVYQKKWTRATDKPLPIAGELMLHGLWITSLFSYLQVFASFNLLIPPLFFGVLLALSYFWRSRGLADVSFLPLLLFFLNVDFSSEDQTVFYASALLYIACLCSMGLLSRVKNQFYFLQQKESFHWLAGILFWAWFLQCAPSLFSWASYNTIILGLGLIFLLRLAYRCHLSWLFITAGGFLIIQMEILDLRLLQQTGRGGIESPWESTVLWQSILTTTGWIALGIVYQIRSVEKTIWTSVVCGLLATANIMVGLYSTNLTINPYYTALIATYSMVLIVVGIFSRIKSYRLIAIGTFAITLARLFLFDIQETLTRIIAFAVISALLIAVGYLYNRFQSKIEPDTTEGR